MIIVSGSPRGGTSLLMSILKSLGYEIIQDDKKIADENNPNGYYEISEIGEKIKEDKEFLTKFSDDQVIKIVSRYLQFVPEDLKCTILYSQRHWFEIWASQAKMANRMVTPIEKRQMVTLDFNTRNIISENENFSVYPINYNDLVINKKVDQLSFLKKFDQEKCLEIIDPELYHNCQMG